MRNRTLALSWIGILTPTTTDLLGQEQQSRCLLNQTIKINESRATVGLSGGLHRRSNRWEWD